MKTPQLALLSLLAASPAFAQTAPAEPASPAAPASPVIDSKWTTHFYGFVELDSIGDSTQSWTEVPGNGTLARHGTWSGDHGRLQLTGRNSRLGFKLAAPEWKGVKASAVLEMDFFGNQPPNASEAAFYTNAGLRFRHLFLKLETPVVDLLAGQTWQLFGMQPYFQPNTVEIQGVPGEVYSRATQLRLSKTMKGSALTLEVDAAAVRPPERDAAFPDLQAGVRLLVNDWKAAHTVGSTGTGIEPGGLGISGIYRRFDLPEFSAKPVNDITATGSGVSIDALVPVLAAHGSDKGNALTLTGSFVRGAGIADLYTGLNGGVGFPSLPNPGKVTPAPAYTPNMDAGIVSIAKDGSLQPVGWQSWMLGLAYYLPGGNVWVAANYSNLRSWNAHEFGASSKIWDHGKWMDGVLMWDATPAVRFGAEISHYEQAYYDGQTAWNNRYQLSAFFLF